MQKTIASTVSSLLGALESNSTMVSSSGTESAVTVVGSTSLTGTAGVVLGLEGLSLIDLEVSSSSTVTVTITDSSGEIGLRRGAWLQEAAFSSDGHTLTLSGSLQQVGQGLNALAYLASDSGTDTVVVSPRTALATAARARLLLPCWHRLRQQEPQERSRCRVLETSKPSQEKRWRSLVCP